MQVKLISFILFFLSFLGNANATLFLQSMFSVKTETELVNESQVRESQSKDKLNVTFILADHDDEEIENRTPSYFSSHQNLTIDRLTFYFTSRI